VLSSSTKEKIGVHLISIAIAVFAGMVNAGSRASPLPPAYV
jgi:hypothetical protein